MRKLPQEIRRIIPVSQAVYYIEIVEGMEE